LFKISLIIFLFTFFFLIFFDKDKEIVNFFLLLNFKYLNAKRFESKTIQY